MINIGPLKPRAEDEFLSDIKNKIKQQLDLDKDDIAFFLKFTYDERDKKFYFAHLNADIFAESNDHSYSSDSEKENKDKNFIVEINNFIDENNKNFIEFFNNHRNRYNLDSNSNTPLNKFLAEIYQFPADFSQGWLGSFYPFCKFTNKCYLSKFDECIKRDSAFNIETFTDCGFYVKKGNKRDKNKLEQISDKKRKLEKINGTGNKEEKIELIKYYILSEVENILFNFNLNWNFVILPIFRRAQLLGLFFINSNNNNFNEKFKKDILGILNNEIIPRINEYYDNEFYHSFFVELENELNYSKILANPKILSKIFAVKEIKETDDNKNFPQNEKQIELKYIGKNGDNGKEDEFEINFAGSVIKFTVMMDSDQFSEEDFERFFQYFIDSIKSLDAVKDAFQRKNLKTAIISILIDSYAHNISAHSLAALKWWFELRNKILDKRFKIDKKDTLLRCINPCIISLDRETTEKTSEEYYKTLDLTDSTYNKDYYSLFDFLQFGDKNGSDLKNIFSFTSKVANKDGKKFHPRFPVPLDYALYPFFRFLRDKGAFWSGVTRDMTFGGETKTWYKILWEDFANNPLYLGTIAKSEGITKLNIYLKVKKDDTNWEEGEFVTIDMSVMDDETIIAESDTLSLKDGNAKQNNDSTTSNNNRSKLAYTKYGFVKLGKKFAKFRDILSNEEKFNVFLPGGIVGEHALFTIFENTIRNIKHYKEELDKIKEHGIDLWISIKEARLEDNKDEKKPELFKVGVWLGHKTQLVKTEKKKIKEGNDEKEIEEQKYLLFDITEKTLDPILDETTGAPRMGGNSQDKACAAMLFNNKFTSVESTEKDRDKKYFPWIEFKTNIKDGDKEVELVWQNSKKIISEESKNEYTNSLNKGYIKKYFHLWRGVDVLDKSALTSDEWENPARAKFLISDNGWTDDEIIKARKNGVIRILDNTKNSSELNNLYKQWLNKWIINNEVSEIVLCDNTDENSLLYINTNGNNILSHSSLSNANKKTNQIKLKLSHGKENTWNCNVRSHGSFINRFFYDLQNGNIKMLDQFIKNIYYKYKEKQKTKRDTLFYELWETILTKVVIFDNRIYNRIPNEYYAKSNGKNSKIEMLEKDLSLIIKNEDKEAFNNWKDNATQNDVNFLVMHLSFIEQLEDDEGKKYSENRIYEFIEKELHKFYRNTQGVNDKFIFVITSGRGRDKWNESLKNDNRHFNTFTIFKPVESLLTAIEQGISYNDHFDIKYNIAKVLFGS